MTTACPNLKCPGLLIYRGSHYECVYCHTHYPAAQIHALAAIPLDTLEDDEDMEELRLRINRAFDEAERFFEHELAPDDDSDTSTSLGAGDA